MNPVKWIATFPFGLECEGGSLGDVINVTRYVTDLSKSAKSQSHEIHREYFGESLPASTRVQFAEPDGPSLLIKIAELSLITEE